MMHQASKKPKDPGSMKTVACSLLAVLKHHPPVKSWGKRDVAVGRMCLKGAWEQASTVSHEPPEFLSPFPHTESSGALNDTVTP